MKANTSNANIATRLKQARLHLGLTPRQVSKLVDVNASTITRIESGATGPRLTTLVKLAKLYDMTTDDIFVALNDA